MEIFERAVEVLERRGKDLHLGPEVHLPGAEVHRGGALVDRTGHACHGPGAEAD